MIFGRRPKQIMEQFLLWLFPYYLGPTRRCGLCYEEFHKELGYYRRGHGWFCTKDHADDFWMEGL